MSAYIIAEIRVTDPVAYERYKALNSFLVLKYGGQFLVRGDQIDTLEGDWHPERVVIIEFPDSTTAKKWWGADEYREAKGLRQAATQTNMILVEGV